MKGWSRCAGDPACTLAAAMKGPCTIWWPRFSTTPWTRPWAGHASRIELTLSKGNVVMVSDNGRGIPVDPHPKYKPKSALEVILTTLHSGAKFSQKAYATSGGLHGVGVSVVNALSDDFLVEVARDQKLFQQSYSKGKPKSKLSKGKPVKREARKDTACHTLDSTGVLPRKLQIGTGGFRHDRGLADGCSPRQPPWQPRRVAIVRFVPFFWHCGFLLKIDCVRVYMSAPWGRGSGGSSFLVKNEGLWP